MPPFDSAAAAILDRVGDAVLALDAQGRYAYANLRACELLGCDAAALVGCTPEEAAARHALPASFTRPWDDAVRRARATGGEQRLRFEAPGADGVRVWEGTVSPAERGAVAVVRDVTPERRAAVERVAAEARTARVLESIADAFFVVDAEWRFTFANTAAERLLGRPRGGLARRRLWDVLPAPLHAPFRDHAEIALAHGIKAEFETHGPERDTWLRVHVYPSSEGVSLYLHDTTRLKHAEQTMRKQARLFEVVSEAVMILDDHPRIVDWNPAAERLFGYTRAEAAGQPPAMLHHPTVRPHLGHEITAALEAGGRWSGELPFVRKDGGAGMAHMVVVREHDAHFAVMRDITMQKALEDQLFHQAFHDALTGLPNRTLLLNRLEHALSRARRNGSALAVLFLDMDRLKQVNDTLGHAAGDDLVIAFTDRVKQVIRDADTFARLSGDEFVVLLEDLGGPGEPVQVAERIQELLRAPFRLAGRDVVASASVGIALGSGERAEAAALVREADVAMYRAKAAGRGRYAVYDPASDGDTVSRMHLEMDLRRALDTGALRLHYQPIVALQGGALGSVEALVRWQHPQRGLVPPDEFVPLAEELELIGPIGAWVMAEAAARLRAWEDAGVVGPEVCVNVNVSVRQLTPELPSLVRRALADARLEPHRLRLEITESMVVGSSDGALEVLRELRAAGVPLVLDDFGTGYSSLSYLGRLPFDILKVDRSFVGALDEGRPEAYNLVQGVISLAHSLRLTVVAEGVETEEQMELLRLWGCDHAQGYGISRPLPPEELVRWITKSA